MKSQPTSACVVAAFFAWLSPVAFAGDVLVVSPTGPYTTIQAALDAAQDYDTVLVKHPAQTTYSYAGFTIDGKSVAVVAQHSLTTVRGEMRVQAVSSGKLAVIGNLTGYGTSSTSYALRLLGNGGSVRVERCTLRGYSSGCSATAVGPCAWVGTDEDPLFIGNSMQGGSPWCDEQFVGAANGQTALFSRSPMLRIFGGSLTGGNGSSVWEDDGWPGGGGGRGLEVPDGITLLVGTTVRGGNGGNGDFESHWDCSPGGPGGSGGHGIVVGSSPPSTATPDVRARGGSVAGGAGGFGGGSECGPNGSNGSPGSPTKVFNGTWTPLAGVARYLDAVPLVRENFNAPLFFHGAPGDRVYILVEEISSALPFVTTGPAHVAGSPEYKPRGTLIGTIGASGTMTKFIPAGQLPPGVGSKWIHIETLFVDSTGAGHRGNEFVLIVVDNSI